VEPWLEEGMISPLVLPDLRCGGPRLLQRRSNLKPSERSRIQLKSSRVIVVEKILKSCRLHTHSQNSEPDGTRWTYIVPVYIIYKCNKDVDKIREGEIGSSMCIILGSLITSYRTCSYATTTQHNPSWQEYSLPRAVFLGLPASTTQLSSTVRH